MSTGVIQDLIARGEEDSVALAAPDRPPLTYGRLERQVERVAGVLRRGGLSRRDRVAIVLPNGPELASSFLSVASYCAAAPLNPALASRELEASLALLRVRAIVTEAGPAGSTVRALAAAAGVDAFEVSVDPGTPAGTFELGGGSVSPGAPTDSVDADDLALLLQTSGTTATPKTVPLRHRNLTASARNIARTLSLGPADQCLNVMPLFHIHGISACLLAPLSVGGSIFCTTGFNALRFFRNLSESGATWYSAVPTMHQAILARSARNADAVRANGLRFIRSSSSALPPAVLHELEKVFSVPVVEAYGMTEAAHQIASNPVDHEARRPGSVGPSAGPDVAIMDEEGELLPPGMVGEIVIRGPNVFSEYEARPEANAQSFVDGWFRTGDQGSMTADGYVTITGRLKEIINRGGENISPREIDEVLLEHPAVQSAVAFAVPHPLLGEDVGAAVVLREGAHATGDELSGFMAERLAHFKVPASLLIVDELPAGATGKIRRLEMAALLGLA